MCIVRRISEDMNYMKTSVPRFLLLAILFFFVLDFRHVSANCPANWDHHSQSCYLFVFRYPLEWIDALSYCKMLGATLVEVNSATEDHYLRQRFRQLSHSTANIWLGGSDILREGSWVWVGSGEAFSYTGWHPTEPNNYHGDEHCALMMFNNNQDWADTNCASPNCFICETSA